MSFTYSPEEILETVRMTKFDNFDIRTITLGVNIKDCSSRNLNELKKSVYNKIFEKAQYLVQKADLMEEKYGVPIVDKRIAVTPVSLVIEPLIENETALKEIALTLDEVASNAGIDFIGGFGALVHKGATRADDSLINSLPEVLSSTEHVCGFVNLASTNTGINMDAVAKMGFIIKQIASNTKNGVGCAKLVCFANAPEDNPFMAGAFHGPGEAEYSINIGISGPGVVRRVVENNPSADLTELSELIKKTTFKITRAGELIGREVGKELGVPFGVVDLTLAPTFMVGDSVAKIIEAMGIEVFGAHGTTAALALLIDAVKKGGVMASSNTGGLSGTFIPVSEDRGAVEALKKNALSLDKLEALTSVCSVGLDMFAIPGSTSAETISGIIADELSIGVVNNKTTGVRVIPVPGKKPGDQVKFGGLLGETIVMNTSRYSSRGFINRKGRLPRPITSMRN